MYSIFLQNFARIHICKPQIEKKIELSSNYRISSFHKIVKQIWFQELHWIDIKITRLLYIDQINITWVFILQKLEEMIRPSNLFIRTFSINKNNDMRFISYFAMLSQVLLKLFLLLISQLRGRKKRKSKWMHWETCVSLRNGTRKFL